MKTQSIIPAIIPDSLEHLQMRLRSLRGEVSRVQIDVMNGSYAPTTSWPYDGAGRDAFESIRREDDGLPYWQDFDFEIDLLLNKPEDRIEEWALAGATCLIVHVESTKKLDIIFSECAQRRVEIALALKPSTDITVLEPYVKQMLFVQCMGNDRIGYHGVTLDESVYDKVAAIHKKWPDLTIGVDIGVREETLPELCSAGATRFATGTAVFGRGTPVDSYHRLEQLVEEETKEQ